MAIILVPQYYVAERELAYYIARLAKSSVQKVAPITDGLVDEQIDAVVKACENPLSVLTGAAGTGKTTTIKQIINSFEAAGMTGYIVTPTGKAAKRADEVVNTERTKTIECSTVNSFLEFNPRTGGFALNRDNKIDADFIVGDEWTMAGVLISRDFMEAVDWKKTRIVLCGDRFQLASVDPGAVFRDIIDSDKIPSTTLRKIHRAALNSGITVNANRMLRGEGVTLFKPNEDNMPTQEKFDDFFLVDEPDPVKAMSTIVKWVKEDLPARRGFDFKQIQVMTPGKNGEAGRHKLNEKLRDSINPATDSSGNISGYRIGDQVMHLKNIRGENLINGDCGTILDIVHGQSGSHAVIDFGPRAGKLKDGIAELSPNQMQERIQMNFAATVHKLQGSEQKCCIFPVYKMHYMLLTRSLIYTGETRAKNLHIFIGEPKTLRIGIANQKEYTRQTRLCQFIQEEMKTKKAS